jgi:hypothetical protein
MATGSGTGTPVTGASAATLATIRNRIRAQLEAATGFPEPETVSASAETLSTLRDRVETTLQDATNARWATGDVDEAIEQAIEQYSRKLPQHAIGTIALAADGREISLSTLTGLVRVEKVWWDYDASTPGYPPNWRQFEVWPGSILYVDDPTEPSNGDTVRVWYTKLHTLNGLNSETTTTFPQEDVGYLISGAAGLCAQMRAVELSEELNVDKDVVKRLEDWAEERTKNFRYGMNLKQPAWQRYSYAYDQDDIDEAVTWALHRYNEVNPDLTISSLTLSATGREVDISSITDYDRIVRVWWDYDSSDPAYPPDWRDFEQWPGDLLYIKDGNEPQSGDVVRIWYRRPHTINGLASASTTTLPADGENLIVTGASGFATQERVQEQPQRSVPRKLREWADARLREFERGLRKLASREGTRHSGIAQGPALDRWDREGEW